MHWSRITSSRTAFTLIELLVSISIIAILISITLPALRGARVGARTTVCLTRLHGLGQGFSLIAGQNGGFWANQFQDDIRKKWGSYSNGMTTYNFTYYQQVSLWVGPFLGVLWHEGDTYEMWTCPEVAKFGYGIIYPGSNTIEESLRINPAAGAHASYFYSPTLISDHRLWDASLPRIPDDPDISMRRNVGIHEVLMPSRKGCLAERADFHGAKVWWADEPDARALNTLFCDGHAERVQVVDTTPTIPTRYFFDGEADDDTVPFLSTPNGYLGDDLAGQ